ncbi:ferredoxin-type protein NapG [Helicobacter sp. 11S03491-1]|uniref:ferredoxin-type protein NapG n=1 Tax=Helicobacter sp. 11S03491-1 TaxID=1476196 RepID=UPI000BA7D719|nr:ferredoxin-type protein NapG [Helicobacter sp. 11S03491-1]PAF41120.1 ferredoxin-type protein NapG [Helicobacter sp. 11S03491-1]
MKKGFDLSRRKNLVKIFQTAGMIAVGGLVWSAYVHEAKASAPFLLPPGARQKDEFLKSCIKCGMCVEACPYYTLKLAQPQDGIVVGIPYFTPREIPCYMCEDIPCLKACPSGALDKNLLKDGDSLNINQARMGVAIIDTKHCIAYGGIQCDACYRACPLIDKALYLEYKRNKNTHKHALLLPMVDNGICTGCGKCEQACITQVASIRVLPHEFVLGKTAPGYIQTWVEDENRHTPINIKRSSDNPTDYLNNGGL